MPAPSDALSSAPLTVGLVFGGVSPEHEVSVISTLQAAAALDRRRYRTVPLYWTKDGAWLTGEALLDLEGYKDLDALRKKARPVMLHPDPQGGLDLVEAGGGGWFRKPARVHVDVLFLGLHGGSGEDGGLQGLCEAYDVPYTGSGILGSAVGMDKVLSKMLCRDQGIPVVEFVAFRESDWAGHEEVWLDRCEERLGYPVIVKPARLGSSIGIARATDRERLDAAVEDALRYDSKVVVEYAVRNLREINCSVLGDPSEAIASVLEEPVTSKGEAFLSYKEKYMRGGGDEGTKGRSAARGARGSKRARSGGSEGMASLDRLIPAPISDVQTESIRALGVRVFQLMEASGVARIDFMMDNATGQVYFNEINTIPGSFSFYLWEPAGVPFDELTHRMIELALRRHRDRHSRVRSYDVNLLAERSFKGKK